MAGREGPALGRLAVLQRHLGSAEPPHDLTAASLACPPCSAAAGAAVLVGGTVLDLQASAAVPSTDADVRRGGSVPGRVAQSPGGVARNVAENLARLCSSGAAPLPLLVSAVGQDAAGRTLLAHLEDLGLSTAGVLQLPRRRTPTVAVVFDRSGEVAACVADVGLLEEALTPRALAAHAQSIAAAPVLMLDGNLSEAAIETACRMAAAAGVPVWFEPVSPPKAVRVTRVLSLLAYISPNEAELVAMAEAVQRQGLGGSCNSSGGAGSNRGSAAGDAMLEVPSAPGSSSSSSSGPQQALQRQQQPATCTSSSGKAGGAACSACHRSGSGSSGALPPDVEAALAPLQPHIATLLRAGVRHIVLTLGSLGAVLCTLHPPPRTDLLLLQHLPALPAEVVNLSGAGDCLVAGCLYGLVRGRGPLEALACGVAAAKAAVESAANVPPGLSAAAVAAGATALLPQAARAAVPL